MNLFSGAGFERTSLKATAREHINKKPLHHSSVSPKEFSRLIQISGMPTGTTFCQRNDT